MVVSSCLVFFFFFFSCTVAYYLFPLQTNSNLTLLGDLSKWVPFSTKRYTSFTASPTTVSSSAAAAASSEDSGSSIFVQLQGAPDETVTTAILKQDDFSIVYVNATIAQDGTASVQWKDGME
jgi:hypothetical protein